MLPPIHRAPPTRFRRGRLDLLKIMLDMNAPASARLRAADIVLAHTAKAIEIEDVEVRVTALEVASNLAKQ